MHLGIGKLAKQQLLNSVLFRHPYLPKPFFSIKFSICVYDLYMVIYSVFLLLLFIATDVILILLEVQMNGE